MNYLWLAIAGLIIALIIAAVRGYRRSRENNVLPAQETMIIIDEAVDMTPEMWRKPKQMKSRPRNKS